MKILRVISNKLQLFRAKDAEESLGTEIRKISYLNQEKFCNLFTQVKRKSG